VGDAFGAIERADVVQAEETAFEDIFAITILAVNPLCVFK
jgi:hypothetical protein